MVNLHDEAGCQQVMLSCCYAGAQLGFRHLPLRHIINPPHEFFDAMLARQVAVHILVHVFDIPRRRASEMLGRGRQGVRMALSTIDYRLEDPLFEQAYRRMSRHAVNLFQQAVQKAAA